MKLENPFSESTIFKALVWFSLIIAICICLEGCGTSKNVPHGCGKKSKRYYHGEFLEYR